jgi:hypothetical protein
MSKPTNQRISEAAQQVSHAATSQAEHHAVRFMPYTGFGLLAPVWSVWQAPRCISPQSLGETGANSPYLGGLVKWEVSIRNRYYASHFAYRQLHIICLLLLWLPFSVFADRGDELLPLIQTEVLKGHIIALQENILQTPKPIVYRTRNAYHRDAANNAAQYIANQFRRSPQLRVKFEDFSGMRNVVAKLLPQRGSASSRIFILCAHYDTKANREPDWNPLTSAAPGANDNATGVAAMLEVAHLLSQFDYEHELRFIAFDSEEIGLMGSRYHAKQAAEAAENIVAVINVDMIGFNWAVDKVEGVTDDASGWLNEAFSIANRWYELGLTIQEIRAETFANGDHKPFWDKGYRAVTLVESTTPWRDSDNYAANPFYHTSRDTIDKINLRLVRKVTQLVLVALDSLASRSFQKHPMIPEVTIDLPATVNQETVQVTGRFQSPFPVEIIVYPGIVTARLDRLNQTYTATVSLSVGRNVIQTAIVYPLGARLVEQAVQFVPESESETTPESEPKVEPESEPEIEPAFEWTQARVFPNPSRRNDMPIVFRAEGNLPMEAMDVSVYASDGSLIKRLAGATDRADARIWQARWNRQNTFGLPVATGIYICRFEVRMAEKIFSHIQRLAILR